MISFPLPSVVPVWIKHKAMNYDPKLTRNVRTNEVRFADLKRAFALILIKYMFKINFKY